MLSCGTALGNNRFLLDLEIANGRSTCNSSAQYKTVSHCKGCVKFRIFGCVRLILFRNKKAQKFCSKFFGT